MRGSCFGLRTAALAAVLIGGTAAVMICASGARSNTSAGYQAGGYQAGVQVRGAQEARKRPRCVPRAKRATSAAGVRRAVASRRDVCVTARVGDVDFSDMGNRSGVVVSTDGGAMGHLEIDSTTGLTIRSARFRSVTIRHGNRTSITRSTIGGTRRHRVYDQLIFAPDTSPNVTIRNNEIAWTLADDSGGTGYGCRCYGTLDNFRFTGNWVHDIAADGLQGFNGTNITIDRNNIGPVGANPGSSEHSDTIQVVGNDAGMKITNNYLHDQGYWRNDDGSLRAVGNAGNIYVHGGSNGSLLIQNNLFTHSQGRTEICGLGTGGNSRSNITIRHNTWVAGGLAYHGFPGFEWDCDSGRGNVIARNIAVDRDGGFAQDGSRRAARFARNIWGRRARVRLDRRGNCVSRNCNPRRRGRIGYRRPAGVRW